MDHPGNGMTRKEARKLANEADKLAGEGKEKPAKKANTGDYWNDLVTLSREAEDLLLAVMGRLKKPEYPVKKARVPFKGQSRFNNPSHKEGGAKASKKERNAEVRDAINGLLGSVGLPGNALNTVRPMSSVR